MMRLLAWLLSFLATTLAAGCAAPTPVAPVAELLRDEQFGARPSHVQAADLFALSPAMLDYVQTQLPPRSATRDPRRTLVNALYAKDGLRLQYDGGVTRTAAEAFEARTGNCLSLVIMTAAFAKHLGMPVNYREVQVEPHYARAGDLTLSSGHVNLVIGLPPVSGRFFDAGDTGLMVDFLSRAEMRGLRTNALQESTIVAMYLNNRAAEALSEGRVDESYWWARQALLQDPGFVAAANTLGVIYAQRGQPQAAEAALRHVLARAPEHAAALSNLAGLLARNGRVAEAQVLEARLAQLQPVRPFREYELGRQAMAAGDFAAASRHFERELAYQPQQDEVHFWAAQAAWRLGDEQATLRHLRLALENSDTRSSQTRYAAKLEHLRAQSLH